jgi:hypothetical protein
MRIRAGETAVRLIEETRDLVPSVYELYVTAKKGKPGLWRRAREVPPMDDLARAAIHWELVAARGATLIFAMPQLITETIDGLDEGDDWKLTEQWALGMCHFIELWFEHETPLRRAGTHLSDEIRSYMGKSIGDGQFSKHAAGAARRMVEKFDSGFVQESVFSTFANEVAELLMRTDLGFIMDDRMSAILEGAIDFDNDAEEEEDAS